MIGKRPHLLLCYLVGDCEHAGDVLSHGADLSKLRRSAASDLGDAEHLQLALQVRQRAHQLRLRLRA